MDINRKIEEIRQKPEHIRLRYIWGLVSISMLFVIIIWVLSIKESAKNLRSDNNVNLPDFSQSLEEIGSIKDSAPSIDALMKNTQNATNASNEPTPNQEGVDNTPQIQDDLQPTTAGN
jgi:hypothetical protein